MRGPLPVLPHTPPAEGRFSFTSLTHFYPMARQPLGGLGRLIFFEVSRSHFRHTTIGRTPLDEGPARRRDLYVTTHNTHNRQTAIP
jgi:hypothetical protein